jgi:hypothetical protein
MTLKLSSEKIGMVEIGFNFNANHTNRRRYGTPWGTQGYRGSFRRGGLKLI